jgi:membrane-associated protease RseP (regulator of RpoE activity)
MRSHTFVGAVLTGLGLALSPGVRLAAQDTTRQTPSDTFEERTGPRGDRLMRIVMNRRARLGIKVNLQPRASDSLGAYVDAVTPGGPAAKAGIRSGDLITKVDGKSVLERGRDRSQDRQSLAGLGLIELAARLEPNDTVAVEFLRGKDRRTVSVVTEDEPEMGFAGQPGERPFMFRFDHEGGPMPAGDFMERMDFPPGMDRLYGGPLAELELAPLNPDLGQYFGTNDGVLVIHAPTDGTLGLKGGDVVQAVDGRKPVSPSHLLRILRSYDRGETFKLDVLRNRKKETITARVAEPEH